MRSSLAFKYLKSLRIFYASERTSALGRHLTGVPSWLHATVFAEIHRWVLWFPVFLGLGVSTYFAIPLEPPLYMGVLTLFILLIVAWLVRENRWALIMLLAVGTMALGFSAAQLRTASLATITLQHEIGPTNVFGRVIKSEPLPKGARLTLDSLQISRLQPFKIPQRVRVRVGTGTVETLPKPGDWVRAWAVLRPPSPPATPRAFDFQRYAYFQGIGATGFSFGLPEIIRRADNTSADFSITPMISRYRLMIGDRIRSVIDGDAGAMAAALVTGQRKAISTQSIESMRDSGLAHLLAISGLHIGLIAGLVFFYVRAILASIPAIAVRYPIKTWAAITALLAALCYTALAGATVPTLRAFTMMALVLGAVMIGRRGISLRLVAAAATVILLVRPESLQGASFQLSFAAVTGLVAAYEFLSKRYAGMYRKRSPQRRMLLYMVGVGFSTLVAASATGPFAAYHFHQLASYGIVANLLAVPITALWIMPCALVSLLLMPFGLEVIALIPMGWGVEAVLNIASAVTAFPGNVRPVSAFPMTALVTMTLGGLWLCLWSQAWRLAGIAGIMIGFMLAANVPQPSILGAPDGKMFAYFDGAAMTLIGPGATSNRFTQKIWRERAGFNETRPPDTMQNIRCDYSGCIILSNNQTIALIWDEGALLEDCWIADIILSAVPVRRACPGPTQVIDRFDFWRNGAYALYINADGLRIENARSVRGQRPWALEPTPRQYVRPDTGT